METAQRQAPEVQQRPVAREVQVGRGAPEVQAGQQAQEQVQATDPTRAWLLILSCHFLSCVLSAGLGYAGPLIWFVEPGLWRKRFQPAGVA